MAESTQFPANWQIAKDFDPNQHIMQLKGKDYLNVQSRLLWFIRDQRALIAAGLATMPYRVQTDLVELDRERGWAHFKTYVRDVLGNEATQYGSESSKDFGDYIEKASTKSLGRALLGLGYGTAFAPEMDEGERVVDSPIERRQPSQPTQAAQPAQQRPAPQQRPQSQQSQQAQRTAPATTRAAGPFNPLADVEFRQRARAIGYASVEAIEQLTGGSKDKAACFAALVAQEQKAALAAGRAS